MDCLCDLCVKKSESFGSDQAHEVEHAVVYFVDVVVFFGEAAAGCAVAEGWRGDVTPIKRG